MCYEIPSHSLLCFVHSPRYAAVVSSQNNRIFRIWKKRFAAILLWTLCLTSMLVLAVLTNAQATTAEASGKSAASLTRGEWIHRLVTKFDLSVSKSDYPDNYYPDLL